MINGSGSWYLTEYRVKDPDLVKPGRYGAMLWATSQKHANQVAKARRLGEKVISGGWLKRRRPFHEKTVLEVLRRRHRPSSEKFHALSFLGWLALKSGVATADEVLGDCGFLHQFAHAIEHKNRHALKHALRMVEDTQNRIPGYMPTGA